MDKHELIKKTFPFLEKELLNEIISVSTLQELKTDESILAEGDYIKSFPMIISGSLRVVRLSEEGNELLLYYLIGGEICSMALTCCIGLQKSKIRMIAEEDSLVITVPVNMPERWMTEYRSWKEYMMYSYKHRFDELLDAIDAIAFMKLDERLVRFFEDRFSSTGKTIFHGTHQDISEQLNTSREVISRLLRNLENKGLVVTERNSVDYSNLVRNKSHL
ncbi:MAG TPA: Crp/Fnr family transcriptional regulator [Bacteroidales bacterium]|nr:Crp/Fnr family transcriptional regulator [Bacteroidales bacterium]